VSGLHPDDEALLRGAQDRARRRLAEGDTSPSLATIMTEIRALPTVPGDRRVMREWRCACGAAFVAMRGGGVCDACRVAAQAAARAARADRLRAAALAPAGEDFAHVHLDHPRLTEWVARPAVLAARKAAPLTYCEEAREWALMLLLGGTGAGKTTLGTAVYRWHLDRALAGDDHGEEFARRMVWVSAVDLARVRRESKLGAEPTLVRRAREASVLLLDDLGQEPPAEQADLVAILSDRQKAHAKTIVTCGFSLDDIGARYGAQLERRLTERAYVMKLSRRVP